MVMIPASALSTVAADFGLQPAGTWVKRFETILQAVYDGMASVRRVDPINKGTPTNQFIFDEAHGDGAVDC